MRKGPGLHYEVVAKILKGMKVHIVGAEVDWLKVQSKHGKPPGYIEKSGSTPLRSLNAETKQLGLC